MRVGLISDTHDHVLRIREATSILNRAGVEAVLHIDQYGSTRSINAGAAAAIAMHAWAVRHAGPPLA